MRGMRALYARRLGTLALLGALAVVAGCGPRAPSLEIAAATATAKAAPLVAHAGTWESVALPAGGGTPLS